MSKRQMYFIKQKLIGVFGLLLAALSIRLLDGDVAVAFLMAIPSLVLIFTKKMFIFDDYYSDVMDKKTKGL